MKKLTKSNGTGKSVVVSPHAKAGRPSGPSLPQSGEGFPPACLRRGEVAGLLQVSVWTVDRMAAAGEIRKVKFGRAARFVRAEVEEFLNKKAESGKAESGKSFRTGTDF